MKQRPLQFGERQHLVGILSLPDNAVRGRPAIILPNTGMEHRVGPGRLHVDLCRAFTAMGFPTLRMDLSGMGDSGLLPGAPLDSVRDQQSALDELQRLGVADRFIGIGVCSGGHDVHLLAKADRRLIAAAFMDHYVYPTARFHLTRLAQRLSEVRRVRNYLLRKLRELRQSDKDRFRPEDVVYFEQPSRTQFLNDIQEFMRRPLALFFLFTGELQYVYNYREQLLDTCPALRGYPHLQLHHFTDADHVFSQQHMRVSLVATLREWLHSL